MHFQAIFLEFLKNTSLWKLDCISSTNEFLDMLSRSKILDEIIIFENHINRIF